MPPAAQAEPLPAPLAERLVTETERILASDGIEGVTLRRVARAAGVTHGAPLRHFRSFSALLSEVAARGFRLLSAAVDDASAALPSGAGPRARLAAGARAYVECAVANPGLFALMFRIDALDLTHATFATDSREAFEHVVRLVRAAQDAGWRTEENTRRLAGACWSQVHGLATLWTQGAYSTVVPNTSLDEAIETTISLLLHDFPERSPS